MYCFCFKEYFKDGTLKFRCTRALSENVCIHEDFYENGSLKEVTTFLNNEIEPCDWPKRGHMVNFQASHWSRALLVFFPTHLGVEGFVIYGWDLSNLGYSPYMTNLGDKSHIIIIRDVFHDGT